MPKPYIGVTGFMSRQEAEEVLKAMPVDSSRQLMIGVLLSRKTLGSGTNKWPNRYPQPGKIAEIFPSHPLAFNLIHYSTKEPETLFDQLSYIAEQGFAGPNCHGFQLNVAWPRPNQIIRFHSTYLSKWIVLQIGNAALEQVENDPVQLANKIENEYKSVDYVLLDPSGGYGKPFDPQKLRDYLLELKSRNLNMGLGVAGGLSPNTMHRLEPLADKFPDLCMDAESRLRDSNDHLDIKTAKEYVRKASDIFSL